MSRDKSKPKKTTRPVPEDQLFKAARFVSYEIRMLIYSRDHLGGFHSSPMATPTNHEKNMALESFLLHFRNLRAFLCPSLQQRNWPDDVFASDFFPDKKEPCDMGDGSVFPQPEQERINKMLAHVSYDRAEYIDGGEHGWEVARMLETILGELERFLANLPTEKRSWFPPAQTINRAKENAAFEKSQKDET